VDITNEFRVPVPVDRAWALLTDIERIAPCLPGAQLTGVEDGLYTGTVKVKVGPVTALFKGTASFADRDDENHVAVLQASGRDSRGQGNASARITARLEPEPDGTRVTVLTDLSITGRVAQFGKGVIKDVSDKLLQSFVTCLEGRLIAADEVAADATPAPDVQPAGPDGELAPPAADVAAVDVVAVARGALLKRAVPVIVAVAVVALLAWLARSALG
jgi:uncharacterized protein